MGRGSSRQITSRPRSCHWGSGGGLNVYSGRRGAWHLGSGQVSTLEPTDLSGWSMTGRGVTTDPVSSLGHLHVAAATMDTGGPRGPPGAWLWPLRSGRQLDSTVAVRAQVQAPGTLRGISGA